MREEKGPYLRQLTRLVELGRKQSLDDKVRGSRRRGMEYKRASRRHHLLQRPSHNVNTSRNAPSHNQKSFPLRV
jgi:hypothetical protein